MRRRTCTAAGVIAGAWLSAALGCSARARAPVSMADAARSATTNRATGTFDVKLTPQPTSLPAGGAPLGRMSLDKRFHGDLEAASTGEMLTAGTGVRSSAGYVAIERVSGALRGRTGTFVLQHSGTMDRGTPRLTIAVVPDSGTDQLAGIAGTMVIDITGGTHSYVFEYTLAGAP